MKLTKRIKGILVVGLMTGGALAQNPNIINNVQNTMQGVQAQKTAASNAALGGPAAPPARPPAGASPQSAASKPSAKLADAKPAAGPHPVIAAKESAAARKAAAEKAKAAKAAAEKAAAEKAAAKNAAPAQAAKPEEKKWSMTGKRDPFFSPVVQQSSGSGCSTGKKCLEIGQIDVRGVVKSETGFIAVVTNGLNKAYFLRENDPVFNGYVIKITGDTVVFQETVQDKLGKPLTREVTKKIVTPAV
jgi:Tfp pilus assembly protein PilP